jgi:L-amino acid N-acyltransferase YncA
LTARGRLEPNVENGEVKVHFEEEGSKLVAVEIGRNSRSPVIVALHRALFALGIVVSSYSARPGAHGLIERVVMTRRDGGAIQGSLNAATRAAILPIALSPESTG